MKKMTTNKTQNGEVVKRMRKIIVIAVVMMMLVIGSQAQAYTIENNWSMNLSTINPAFSDATDIDKLIVQGTATLTLAGAPATGITFTEDARLQIASYVKEGAFFASNFSIGSNFMYIEALGLAGEITSFGPGGYQYIFYPGVGTIKVYLGTGNTATDLVLASLSVIAPSGGNGIVVDGGVGPSGTTGLDALFLSALPGLWTTGTGFDFGPYGIALLDAINTVKAVGSNQLVFTISSQGEVNTVVPEPSTFVLIGAGLIGLGLAARRRMK
ncbi:MAG TPA: PEP-CTERM sorting domain-containing protein [Dissulfurispiraceae bacterium]|nr:PEP-CTERM sorting domain-containing protein [Dissulfurispiraceae bacterium]